MSKKALYQTLRSSISDHVASHLSSGGVVAVGMLFDDIEAALTSTLNPETLEAAIATVLSEKALKQRVKHIALQTGHADVRSLKSHLKKSAEEHAAIDAFLRESLKAFLPKAYGALGLLGLLQLLSVLDPSSPPPNVQSVEQHLAHISSQLNQLFQ